MKILKRIGLTLLAIIVLLVLVAFLLPRKIHVERSIVINKPIADVFAVVNDFSNFNAWSPWHELDTAATYAYSENTAGKDAWFSWSSKNSNVGKGKMTIMESTPHELVKCKLEFEGMAPSEASFVMKEQKEGTQMTWTMDSDVGYNPVGRWFGVFMDMLLGPMYDKGLAKLKKVTEEATAQLKVAGFDVAMQDIAPVNYLHVAYKNVKMNEIGLRIGEGLMSIDAFIKSSKLTPTGAPLTVWTDVSNFSVGIPIKEKDVKASGAIMWSELQPCKAYVVKYYGPYEQSMPVYEGMNALMKEQGQTPGGAPRESYVSDPMLEKDTAKWLTEIIFPVKQ